MEEIKHKDYREYLMKEPLKAIAIGYIEVTKEEKKNGKKMTKKAKKRVNKRLEKSKFKKV